ncbi:DUF3307 domain-containing protein [Alteromonas oceanisediminis]|uniref:DUF3307 domain-containing protein n=1 Tax=Alteromonas oceanisediminis TaxID=2836180 RepID=UPI001BDB4CBA|nr:DUF3307 domain-containing protein [Alteromonas oceanisediminis]MBT0588179.1 DUF3307 domain-containing protein [Alteromonas oceanisediminis]
MSDFLVYLIPFLLTHVVCDFYLQPNRWIEAKKANTYRSPELYSHSLLHGVAMLLPAVVLGIDWHLTAYLVVVVAVSHYLIDLWKVTTSNGDTLTYFVLDQALHIVVLVLAAVYLTGGISLNTVLAHENLPKGIAILFAYLVILKPSSIVIGSILKNYPIANVDAEQEPKTGGLVAGGELIGYLERTLILTFTLVGNYAAVGFVLAAKSIFRFGDLNKSNDRSMTEYVLIGSLLSVVMTTVVGILISLAAGLSSK